MGSLSVKNASEKFSRLGTFNYECNGAVNVAWCCQIYPAKSLNGAPKWPSLSLMPFKGPKKSQAPHKVSILCKGPF